MKRLDAGKAVGLAVLILALNLVITAAVITVYVLVTKRAGVGDVPAVQIAEWSAPIGGGLLFFAASWILGRRRLDRSGLGFAGLTWLAYVIVDIGSGLAMGEARAMLSMPMAASMGLAFLGAIAGSALARRSGRGPIHLTSNASTLETRT